MRVGFLERGWGQIDIFDTLRAHQSVGEHRHRVAQWVIEHDALIRRALVGSVYIIRSPVVRLAYQVMVWLKPLPYPSVVVEDMPSALRWAAERFRQVGQHAQAQRVLERVAQDSAA